LRASKRRTLPSAQTTKHTIQAKHNVPRNSTKVAQTSPESGRGADNMEKDDDDSETDGDLDELDNVGHSSRSVIRNSYSNADTTTGAARRTAKTMLYEEDFVVADESHAIRRGI